MRKLVAVAVCVISACGGTRPTVSAPHKSAAARSTPFDYVGQSWVRVPATVGAVHVRLMFDTGGGVTVLSRSLCRRVRCTPDGTYSGQRMSGQTIHLQMVRVPSITIAGHRVEQARVAVMDTRSLLHPDLGVEGVAALDLFTDQPFTIDHGSHLFALEDAASLAARRKAGTVAHVRVERDGPSAVVYLPFELSAGGPRVEAEVDTGSRDLILDQRFMSTLGIAPDGAGVKRVEGRDQTGAAYVRFFSKLPRAIDVPGEPALSVAAGSTVMFQRIIHDGLVGHAFLSGYAVTFDIPRSSLVFASNRSTNPE